MKKKLKLRAFQIGSPPKRGEGLRAATTRRQPRGVPRARWRRDGYFAAAKSQGSRSIAGLPDGKQVHSNSAKKLSACHR